MEKDLIGLEVCQAASLLEQSGEVNFKFISYTDKKQSRSDTERVCAVRRNDDGTLTLVVCPLLLVPVG